MSSVEGYGLEEALLVVESQAHKLADMARRWAPIVEAAQALVKHWEIVPVDEAWRDREHDLLEALVMAVEAS